ncbi:hypothetical protein CHS0354_026565 [Potamilus streckersoni]|uniref:B box-type domain-containing protein n=1 Tax=Potamilus streckersoni TaxID=2493646 RepID=A0AAE0RQE7_9BIVA|nr:hypothetical protein CHS0354_026565 [Potamilus streckersoni]
MTDGTTITDKIPQEKEIGKTIYTNESDKKVRETNLTLPQEEMLSQHEAWTPTPGEVDLHTVYYHGLWRLFCETCLESHISRARPNSKFQCPLCREEIDIPEGGARSLQSNFYIETTAEITDKEKSIVVGPCENCDSDQKPESTTYCKVCELNICENCVLHHQKLKATKSHELVSLVEYARNADKGEKYCYKHESKVAERYCSACELFLCSSCKDHGMHTVETIDVAIDKRKKSVQRTLIESEVYLKIIEEKCRAIPDLESLIRDSEAKNMELLQKRANAMKEEIDSGMKQLSEQIIEMCESELNKLNKKQTMLNITSAREKHEAVKRWISNACDEELLKCCDRMRLEVMEANASLSLYNPSVRFITFTKGQALSTKSIGSLEFTAPGPYTKQLELSNTFILPDNREVVYMASSKENQVWMVEKDINGLTLYSERGIKKRHILEDLTISAVDFDRDCNLFASAPKNNTVYKIGPDFNITTFCTLPDTPGPLAARPDGGIAVCCGASNKTLLLIDQYGTIVTGVQPKYKSFYCIASCKYTNIICTVEAEYSLYSGPTSWLVNLFDHKGKKIREASFTSIITCITSDYKGHFLLSHNNGITVIDSKGNELTKLTSPHYSLKANSLVVDALNQLWISGSARQVFIFKYPKFRV